MLESINSVRAQINSSNISGSSSKPARAIADTVLSRTAPITTKTVKAAELYSTSSIRVDNLQNVAILEFRSAETGEVIAQFPTQKQIEAFRVAQSISDKLAEKAITRPETSIETPVKTLPLNSGSAQQVSTPILPAPTTSSPPISPLVAASAAASYVAFSSTPVITGEVGLSTASSRGSSIVV